MDENRDRAYLELIHTLLNCPNGDEPQILQDNRELLDRGFLQACELVAEILAEQGQENAANFLQNLASQLGEFMEANDPESENSQEYENFILELLQAEAKYSGIKVIYPILGQRQHLLNARFAETLQEVAQRLIAENPEAIESIVALIKNLSIHISDFPRGNRANNLEIAITGYQIVLNNREPGSEQWAMTQNNLANAYLYRINGSRADNLERAIEFYQNALTVYTFEDFREDWAMTQNNLAAAYLYRINGSRADNLERAIAFYQAALTVYTLEDFPEKWAGTQNNLAVAYSDRINGSRADNLERAIAFYQAALTVRTFEDFPEKWAETQNNLANAYSDRINGSRADNLERAIEFYQAALTVRTFEDFPEDWAMTQNNLAVAYLYRINGSRADNLERAIAFYQAALTVRTFEDFPEKWAETQNNLAITYSDRINGSRADNLERAIAFYQAAITVYTLEDFPEQWAMTQNNLAITYSDRINGSRADNLERAIPFFQAAITVYTLEDFPEQWAKTQNNLALAYSDRINGSRADNLERAIEFYQAALTVRTFEDFPEEWAGTQNNLANAYRNRINGSRADNLERAIEFYQAALRVRTLEDFPEQWAMTQNNLAIAYSNRINGSRADNLERAIEFYQAALRVRTLEDFPQNHTETLSNLGNLYRSNQQWQLAYDTYIPAIETVEFLRGEIQSGDETKQKLAEEWNQLYLGIVEVCIELERYDEAVEFADRSKAQNLIELLSVKDLYPKGEIPPEVRRELQQLRVRIADENQRLKQAEEKSYDTINQLRQELAAKYPYTPLKFGEIKQSINEKTAIVEWYILNNSFCAFTIAKNNSQPQFFSFNESDLQRLVDWGNEYLRDYYSNRQQWQNTLGTKLANLAQILHIDEILAAIPENCDKLILIPHRYLHLFPIHALPVSREIWQRFHRDNENCPLNPCLVDCFDKGVSYAPSCQILHQVQKYKRGKFDKFFAIQNPTDNLMAADMEVETIKNIFPDNPPPKILAKEDAKKGARSEDKLEIAEKVADSHHLFFSCHGSFDRNEPLKSGLQLADGTLTLEEIIRYFNLSECSLVTLSACETGQVQLDNTDEYISLTSGFLLAGSPSLYVTLWSVNALSTAILLIKTYENLYHQPGKLALALNQAQIWMRDTDIQGFLNWTNQCHLLDDNWRETLRYCLEEDKATQGVCAKIYQNPYHWAGFCAAGKGEQNMTNSSDKLKIFQQLIQESDLFVNLRDALVSLKAQLTDNDEENIKIVQNWLQDKPAIQNRYNAKLMKSDEVKLPNKGKSPTKPGEQSKLLIEMIENVTIASEKPPEPKQDTPSSP
jgi:CHAT domain-containing protein/plasmid maintenance system killer protein